jgi:glycosyltransferase involved in cell wall biosynthesis
MVNPRPNSVVDSQHNFPSKLLEYLSYGKPVISTCTPGIAPEYSHVIDIPEDETPAGLAGVIQRVLQWSEVQRRERAVAIREFLKTRKTWIVQARRLTEWLEDQMLR